MPDPARKPAAVANLVVAFVVAVALDSCTTNRDATGTTLPPLDLAELAGQRVIERLPAGSLVHIGPTELTSVATGAFTDDPDTKLVDAWLRELMRCSSVLDVAGPDAATRAEDVLDAGAPRAVEVVCAIDSQAGVWTTRLEEDRLPPRPLAVVSRTSERALADVVSELALRTRFALGDEAAGTAPMPTPLSVYSQSAECALATERGRRLHQQGSSSAARLEFENALTADPGCTLTIASLLAVELELGGDPRRIRERARSALRGLGARTAPTTRHRLARVFLLASVDDPTAPPGREDDVFDKLAELAEETLADRPYDPHALYTRALAWNFTRQFEESAVLLRRLHARWPRQARVAYHLCFAELALGRPEEALLAIRSASRGLPPGRDVLPLAMALFESGRHDELETWLQRLARSAENDTIGQKLHDVRRMQASLAILRGRRDVAAAYLLGDLEWLRQRPSRLQTLAGELSEEGQVLILLGYAEQLEEPLAALQDLQIDSPALGNALVFLAGLLRVAGADGVPEAALRELEQRGAKAWSAVLRATVARDAGDVTGEIAQLGRAAQIDSTPLIRARLARALRAGGQLEYADRILSQLRRDASVETIDLRRPRRHALFQPGLALALLAPGSDAPGADDHARSRSSSERESPEPR
jgi:tetratricopeptide (TPR) repeat protein